MIKDKRTQFSKTCKRVLAKEKSSNIMKTRKKVEQDNTLDGKSSENMGFESDDEDTEMPELSSDGSFKKKKFRTRQYSKENKGPFVVCIRAIDEKTPLKPMKLTKLIFGTCASEILIRQVNANKMRVTFSPKTPSDESCDVARREANALPMCEWSSKYRIYIPEKLVEVMGCIAWPTRENIDEFITHGEGKFKNMLLPNVAVLDAMRFIKKIETPTETKLVQTNVVRITFSGLVLPEHVNIFGLLIPVREFKRRQMFCDNCLSYNHTKAHCNNKAKSQATNSCLQCQGDHQSGDKNCPRRKFLEKRDNDREKNIQKKTYAEMLRQFDPESLMPGEMEEESVPLNLGTRKERHLKRPSNETSTSNDFVSKKFRVNTTPEETPPGFKNPNFIEEDTITSFINSLLNELELPPFITDLINKFIIPLVHKFVKNITNSFMQKISLLSQ